MGTSLISLLSSGTASASGALIFKGEINVPADFPTLAAVQNGWTFLIKTNVTDNDPTRTNTGQSFLVDEEIAWNGTDWTPLGSAAITQFSDNTFEVFNLADNTRKMMIDSSNITTSTTRTLTMANRNLNLDTPVFNSVTVDSIFINGTTITSSTSSLNFTTTGSSHPMTVGTSGGGSALTLKSGTSISLTPGSSSSVSVTQGSFKVEKISMNDNDLTTNATNANLDITPNGNGKINFGKPIIKEVASLLSVVAATGITGVQDEIIPVESSTGGDTNITANPQIVAGVSGELRTIVGTDNTKTVTLDNGDGLSLDGGVSCTVGLNDTITFIFYNSLWLETSRSNNS